MQWNNTMVAPEWSLVLEIAQNVALIGMAAYLLSRLKAFKRTVSYSESRRYDKILLGLIFGLFSAAGNWIGIPVHGAIANSRIVGAVAGGLVGGPLVGFMAGTIGALARYFMGGFTVWPSVLSNIIVGFLCGLAHKRLGSRGIDVKTAFLLAFASECILKLMILTMAKPFEAAWKLEQTIAIPTMLGNSCAVALFIYILRDVVSEQQRTQAFSAQQAIRMIQKTSNLFQAGLGEQSARAVALIIWNEMRPAAAAITDNEKVLAFIGKGDDHHKPGMPIVTQATKRAVSSKQTVIVSSREDIGCPHPGCELSAAIDAPITVLGELAGTIKVYKTGNESITPYETQLIQGIADFISVQLAQQRFEQQQLILLQTEYSMLKAQINPHFFYNTLSIIQSMVRKDAEAVNLIQDLADFFRRTLKRGAEIVSLREELECVQTYFRIEKARFRDRVNLIADIPGDLQDIAIPVFSLQPLVDNAIRHGIGMKREGGTVVILARAATGKVLITVEDDGAGMAEEQVRHALAGAWEGMSPKGTGIGLPNINRRIQKLFGAEYGLSIVSEAGRGTQVTVALPLERSKAVC